MSDHLPFLVIIPTLNEEEHIRATLQKLGESSGVVNSIIIADAGSEDATVEIAEKFGCEVLRDLPRCRARQLNAAANHTNEDVLVFLHADTLIEPATLTTLRRELENNPDLIGGGFHRRFDSASLFLRVTCWLAGWRGRLWGIFFGDQGMFVRREIIKKLGGFDESLPVGEDLDFSLRLRKQAGKTKIIGPPVLSSARRFERIGPLRQTCADFRTAIRLKYFANKKRLK